MTYTQASVETLLKTYLDIRLLLIDRSFVSTDIIYLIPPQEYKEMALGGHNIFGVKSRAQPVMDGKRTSRAMEELHCASIDLEEGLKQLRDDDYYTVLHYYLFRDKTLDEIAVDLGLLDRRVAHNKATRALKKLTKIMQESKREEYES
jgi:hypothetical protein